jgi:hypothetical protein
VRLCLLAECLIKLIKSEMRYLMGDTGKNTIDLVEQQAILLLNKTYN